MPVRGPTKPSSSEDEFFAKEDAEKKRRLTQQVTKELAADERKKLRDLHFMHCPKCGMKMQEVRLHGMDVEVCFACGGIFLDKGEIDIIAAPQQKGIMGAILNWFKDETKPG
ncbi:MAG: zf-TFIIB domain-containing protein [Deltaproteobacteria bacterium]|nr:zf-TFIIB domain-containing protein [Deltaproteobacteria bacterium]